MNRKTVAIVLVWSLAISACKGEDCTKPVGSPEPAKMAVAGPARPDKPVSKYTLDEILDTLRNRTAQLTSYKCKVNYLFIQDPELLDSRTLRKGTLYYLKDKAGSRIRVNFDTMKQDEGKETAHKEQFMFDGVYLVKIDYQLKKVDRYQQVEINKPVDVFEFVSHNFPIVGFSKSEDLRKQFDIKVVDKAADSSKPIRLHLKVRKDSVYKEDYTDIDFWIDSRTFLPSRIVSKSTEEDVYDIQLTDAAINKKMENSVFKLETPSGFSKNEHPLKRKSESEK